MLILVPDCFQAFYHSKIKFQVHVHIYLKRQENRIASLLSSKIKNSEKTSSKLLNICYAVSCQEPKILQILHRKFKFHSFSYFMRSMQFLLVWIFLHFINNINPWNDLSSNKTHILIRFAENLKNNRWKYKNLAKF